MNEAMNEAMNTFFMEKYLLRGRGNSELKT